ncbi:MAG: hypothetical protein HF982_14920 [Desulfobacteraceae bacterium]|nr:hypothetical protein [Desulfobacteraceae bacterium]MBC2720848.1 hypothetical protein [Desulfobacteraceae bacterium]
MNSGSGHSWLFLFRAASRSTAEDSTVPFFFCNQDRGHMARVLMIKLENVDIQTKELKLEIGERWVEIHFQVHIYLGSELLKTV